MSDTIRIRCSAGLLIVALVHAIALAGVFVGMQDFRTVRVAEPVWQVPQRTYPEQSNYVQKLEQPASVNLQAQGEIKQGEIKQQRPCVPCSQPTDRSFVRQPTLVRQPAPIQPSPARPQAAVPATMPRKQFQISLFVTGDERSNVLLQWFQRDPSMLKLREKAEFQIYTPENAVYRARFAAAVPVDQFPVVLMTDANGGHIHAAGKAMIPRTCAELNDDMREGYKLYLQAQAAPKTGAIKSTGYSWDDAITPAMRLSPEDCPDDNCPLDGQSPETTWRPGDRVRDVLFDEGPGIARDAFLWANVGEIATVGIIFILGCMIAFVFVRRVG